MTVLPHEDLWVVYPPSKNPHGEARFYKPRMTQVTGAIVRDGVVFIGDKALTDAKDSSLQTFDETKVWKDPDGWLWGAAGHYDFGPSITTQWAAKKPRTGTSAELALNVAGQLDWFAHDRIGVGRIRAIDLPHVVLWIPGDRVLYRLQPEGHPLLIRYMVNRCSHTVIGSSADWAIPCLDAVHPSTLSMAEFTEFAYELILEASKRDRYVGIGSNHPDVLWCPVGRDARSLGNDVLDAVRQGIQGRRPDLF